MGLATYGRSFNLISSSATKIGAPCKGAGVSGPFTRESGFMAYYEICDKIKSGMSVARDEKAMAPYGYKGKYWIGYDDMESIRYKVKKLIKGRGLKGAMFWSMDLDDFTGSHCGQGKYPLINAVKKELEGQKPIVSIISKIKHTKSHSENMTVATSTSTISTKATTIISSGNKGKCFAKGVWFGNSAMNQWCFKNCVQGGNCSPKFCSCIEHATTPTTTTPTISTPIATSTTTTTTSIKVVKATDSDNQKPKKCFGINIWYGNPEINKWCNKNCLGKNCEQSIYCSCDENWKPKKSCHGVRIWKDNIELKKWCTVNCAVGYCPSSFCACRQ